MTYVEISKQWFEHTLSNLGKIGYKWEEIKDPNVKESIYMVHINDIHLKVFSSIEDGVSRDSGKDAIRVVGWDITSDRPISSSEMRVNRTENWSENLKKRINDVVSKVVDVMNAPKCKICGGVMAEMNGKFGKFNGCLNYKAHGDVKNKVEKVEGILNEKDVRFWE